MLKRRKCFKAQFSMKMCEHKFPIIRLTIKVKISLKFIIPRFFLCLFFFSERSYNIIFHFNWQLAVMLCGNMNDVHIFFLITIYVWVRVIRHVSNFMEDERKKAFYCKHDCFLHYRFIGNSLWKKLTNSSCDY